VLMRHYTWIHIQPDSCPLCSAGYLAELNSAHLGLYFPAAPETVIVSVSVVAVVPVTGRFQDPTVLVCYPVQHTLVGDIPNASFDFAMPVANGCGIEIPPVGIGQAFLAFVFESSSDTTVMNRPRLVVQQLGRFCTTYNPVGDTNIDFVANYQTGN